MLKVKIDAINSSKFMKVVKGGESYDYEDNDYIDFNSKVKIFFNGYFNKKGYSWKNFVRNTIWNKEFNKQNEINENIDLIIKRTYDTIVSKGKLDMEWIEWETADLNWIMIVGVKK